MVGVARDEMDELEVEQLERRLPDALAEPSVERGGGDLDERAAPHERFDSIGEVLELGASLRMGDHGRDALGDESADVVRQPQRPAVVRELEQNVRRIASEAEAANVVERQAVEELEADLPACEHLELDARPRELVAQGSDGRLHLRDGRRIVVAHVRRRRDGCDAVGDARPGHVEAVLERAGTVVEVWEDVRVEVDHEAHEP